MRNTFPKLIAIAEAAKELKVVGTHAGSGHEFVPWGLVNDVLVAVAALEAE